MRLELGVGSFHQLIKKRLWFLLFNCMRTQTVRLVPMLLFCSLIPAALAQVPRDPGEPGVITGKVIDSVGESVPGARQAVE
jgi:hypothetical protein